MCNCNNVLAGSANKSKELADTVEKDKIVISANKIMKIALAADHAGYEEKEKLKKTLDEIGIEYEDMGTTSTTSVDYPQFAQKVGRAVASGEYDQGLLVCGSGTGMAIAANKVPGVRAAVAWTEEIARLARQHNNANVLSLPARYVSEDELNKVVKAWFGAEFEGGRHERRVEQIEHLS
jgi:ribose 5-phosphate isomerase B